MANMQFTPDLISFIEKLNDIPVGMITAQTPLIEAGYIDSFSIMQLIMFIEERCNVSITIESLSLDTISTIDTIASIYYTGVEL